MSELSWKSYYPKQEPHEVCRCAANTPFVVDGPCFTSKYPRESLGYTPKHRYPLSDWSHKSSKIWAKPNALFCRNSCTGGFIPEISTLHPVANADALEGVVRPQGRVGETSLTGNRHEHVYLHL